jgi:hypothetical protein
MHGLGEDYPLASGAGGLSADGAAMACRWGEAAAFLQFKSSQDVSRKAATQKNDLNVAALDIELAAHHRQIQSDHVRLGQDRASNIGGLHDATEE